MIWCPKVARNREFVIYGYLIMRTDSRVSGLRKASLMFSFLVFPIFRKTIQKHQETTLPNDEKFTLKY